MALYNSLVTACARAGDARGAEEAAALLEEATSQHNTTITT